MMDRRYLYFSFFLESVSPSFPSQPSSPSCCLIPMTICQSLVVLALPIWQFAILSSRRFGSDDNFSEPCRLGRSPIRHFAVSAGRSFGSNDNLSEPCRFGVAVSAVRRFVRSPFRQGQFVRALPFRQFAVLAEG